jgi:bifunctional non-homologous end joining protein LigD
MSTDRSRLPQRPKPSDAIVRSVDWIYEPYWRGERLLAAVRDGQVSLTDEDGSPVSDPALTEAAGVLRRALVDADGALVDGVWTTQPFPGDAVPAAAIADEPPVDPLAGDHGPVFVAVDLVELDGRPLHEVPCLERRRLLQSVLNETLRVRISPAVRMPVANWIEAWRKSGFDAYVAKHVNSRYRPGSVAEDWLRLQTVPQVPSTLERLMGRRQKPVVRIEDNIPR